MYLRKDGMNSNQPRNLRTHSYCSSSFIALSVALSVADGHQNWLHAVARILVAVGWFLLYFIVAGMFAILLAKMFMPRFRGATWRLVRIWSAVLLTFMCVSFWAIAIGFEQIQGVKFTSSQKYATALGFSITALQEVSDRLRAPNGDVSGKAGTDPAPRAPRPVSLLNVKTIRIIDYVLGASLSGELLLIGAAIGADKHAYQAGVTHWLTGFLNVRLATFTSEPLLILIGFLYSQLISAGSIRVLSAALGADLRVSRTWNYLLLVPPFLLLAPVAWLAPGVLLGMTVHLATLYVGWKYTDEPPRTTLHTLKLVRLRLASYEDRREGRLNWILDRLFRPPKVRTPEESDGSSSDA